MAAPPRIEVIGAAYHVNIKAVAGVRAFPEHVHRDRLLRLLREEIVTSRWTCLGYTILGTHYHVIVQLSKSTLSSGFQRLNSRYAKWFNAEHGRTGALWQARFYDVRIESAYHFFEEQRYLAWNAPRAGLVENPEDWQYCHYGSLIGHFASDALVDEDAILRLLAPTRRRARDRLRAYVEEPDRRVRYEMLLRGTSEERMRPWRLQRAA